MRVGIKSFVFVAFINFAFAYWANFPLSAQVCYYFLGIRATLTLSFHIGKASERWQNALAGFWSWSETVTMYLLICIAILVLTEKNTTIGFLLGSPVLLLNVVSEWATSAAKSPSLYRKEKELKVTLSALNYWKQKVNLCPETVGRTRDKV